VAVAAALAASLGVDEGAGAVEGGRHRGSCCLREVIKSDLNSNGSLFITDNLMFYVTYL